MKSAIGFTIIIPVYNEEMVICETYHRLTEVMQSVGESFELLFVNDGSEDHTAAIIRELAQADSRVRLLDFSRNFGHQIAITAGMDYARGEAVVIIDGDLQDPPEVIPQMIEKWRQGYEVVFGRRLKREGETLFKKWTAALFYRVLRALTEVDIPLDAGDFRLMDRRVCEIMRSLREKNRFVRGLVSWVGFRQTAVEYVREERFAGESKYPLKKMFRLAMDGITSFSYKPLKLAAYLGSLVSLAGLVCLLVCLGQQLFTVRTVAGWGWMSGALLLSNGLVLIAVGILGEYLGRIFEEIKDRPLYILRNRPESETSRYSENTRYNEVRLHVR